MAINDSRYRSNLASRTTATRQVGANYEQRRHYEKAQQLAEKPSGTIQKIKDLVVRDLFGFSKDPVSHSPNAHFEKRTVQKSLHDIENKPVGPHRHSDEKLINFLTLFSNPPKKAAKKA